MVMVMVQVVVMVMVKVRTRFIRPKLFAYADTVHDLQFVQHPILDGCEAS